jgi:hypothetical protein
MEMTQEAKDRIQGFIDEYLRQKFPYLYKAHHHSHKVMCPVCLRDGTETVLVKRVDLGASGEEDCHVCKNTIRFVFMSNGQMKTWRIAGEKE